MNENKNSTLLVTGASGRLGRRVVELLLESQAGPLVAATRRPDQLKDLAARGAEVRFADFDDPSSLDKAFAGAERMLLISTNETARPGQKLVQHRNAIAAAEKAGVATVAYTSEPHLKPGNPYLLAQADTGTEEALAQSRLGWVILRHNWYTDLLVPRLAKAAAAGKFLTTEGDSGAAYVTREDCARADAALLVSPGPPNRILDITGPAVVPNAQLAEIAGRVTGRPVKQLVVSPDTYKSGLVMAGIAETLQEIMTSSDVAIAQGYLAVVSNAVRELTGREPQSVEDFLLANRETLLAKVLKS